jgi:hypothetical protein
MSLYWPQYTATKIPFMYSFSGNCAASAPISTFMFPWAIYKFPGLVHIIPPAEKADPSLEYIIRSQKHECGNWDQDPRYSFSGNICFKFLAFCLCSVVFKQLAMIGIECNVYKQLYFKCQLKYMLNGWWCVRRSTNRFQNLIVMTWCSLHV